MKQHNRVQYNVMHKFVEILDNIAHFGQIFYQIKSLYLYVYFPLVELVEVDPDPIPVIHLYKLITLVVAPNEN